MNRRIAVRYGIAVVGSGFGFLSLSGCSPSKTEPCPLCHGSGRTTSGACTVCRGLGYCEVSEYELKARAEAEENLRRRERGESPPGWWERNRRGAGFLAFFAIAWIAREWKNDRSTTSKSSTPQPNAGESSTT
jgi:hypothetical protein